MPYITCANLLDLEPLARAKLPEPIFDFIAGGAEDEASLRVNRAVFEAIRFRPRAVVDVSKCDTSASVLGQQLPLPLTSPWNAGLPNLPFPGRPAPR